MLKHYNGYVFLLTKNVQGDSQRIKSKMERVVDNNLLINRNSSFNVNTSNIDAYFDYNKQSHIVPFQPYMSYMEHIDNNLFEKSK